MKELAVDGRPMRVAGSGTEKPAASCHHSHLQQNPHELAWARAAEVAQGVAVDLF